MYILNVHLGLPTQNSHSDYEPFLKRLHYEYYLIKEEQPVMSRPITSTGWHFLN